MRDYELYQQLLGLCAPWYVHTVDLSVETEQVIVKVQHQDSIPLSCPICQQEMPGYDSRIRRWRHLDTCQYQTILEAEVPRGQCSDHGVHQIRVPWAEARSRFTALFERLIIDWLQEASQDSVATRLGLTWDEVHGVMDRAVARGLLRRKKKCLRRVGVDEKAFKKGHQYVTIVSDLDAGIVLGVEDDRKKSSLDAFYTSLTSAQREGIEEVAMDMWEPFIQSTLTHIPQAQDKIVFDKFHIVKNLTEAVDKVRRQEHKILQKNKDDTLKGSKYLWLKNPKNFTRKTWLNFKTLRQSTLKTARAWALKEMVMKVWDYTYKGAAQRFFNQWYSWAIRSRLEPMKKVAKLMKGRLPNILTHLKSRLTNAMAEGFNSRIQWIQATARGFRNRQNFKTAILFHLGGLDLYPH